MDKPVKFLAMYITLYLIQLTLKDIITPFERTLFILFLVFLIVVFLYFVVDYIDDPDE